MPVHPIWRLALLACALTIAPVWAAVEGPVRSKHVEAQLVSEVETIQPGRTP
jgi:hypothetical protein